MKIITSFKFWGLEIFSILRPSQRAIEWILSIVKYCGIESTILT